jgi:hypothetical protein
LSFMRCPAVREVDVLHGQEFASFRVAAVCCAAWTYARQFIADIP